MNRHQYSAEKFIDWTMFFRELIVLVLLLVVLVLLFGGFVPDPRY